MISSEAEVKAKSESKSEAGAEAEAEGDEEEREEVGKGEEQVISEAAEVAGVGGEGRASGAAAKIVERPLWAASVERETGAAETSPATRCSPGGSPAATRRDRVVEGGECRGTQRSRSRSGGDHGVWDHCV